MKKVKGCFGKKKLNKKQFKYWNKCQLKVNIYLQTDFKKMYSWKNLQKHITLLKQTKIKTENMINES